MRKEFKEQAERVVRKSGISFPFPDNLDFSGMPSIQFIDPYRVDYLHSFGQDSPFFLGLKQKKLLGSLCGHCGYRYATPRAACMYCGEKTEWFKLPLQGRVHAFTVCHFGSEKFLSETPFVLALIEFDGVDTLFLSRMKEVDPNAPAINWIGMRVGARFARNIGRKEYVPSVADVWFVPKKKET